MINNLPAETSEAIGQCVDPSNITIDITNNPAMDPHALKSLTPSALDVVGRLNGDLATVSANNCSEECTGSETKVIERLVPGTGNMLMDWVGLGKYETITLTRCPVSWYTGTVE